MGWNRLILVAAFVRTPVISHRARASRMPQPIESAALLRGAATRVGIASFVSNCGSRTGRDTRACGFARRGSLPAYPQTRAQLEAPSAPFPPSQRPVIQKRRLEVSRFGVPPSGGTVAEPAETGTPNPGPPEGGTPSWSVTQGHRPATPQPRPERVCERRPG